MGLLGRRGNPFSNNLAFRFFCFSCMCSKHVVRAVAWDDKTCWSDQMPTTRRDSIRNMMSWGVYSVDLHTTVNYFETIICKKYLLKLKNHQNWSKIHIRIQYFLDSPKWPLFFRIFDWKWPTVETASKINFNFALII